MGEGWREGGGGGGVDDSDELCRCVHGAIDKPPHVFRFERAGNRSDVEMKNKLLGRNDGNTERKEKEKCELILEQKILSSGLSSCCVPTDSSKRHLLAFKSLLIAFPDKLHLIRHQKKKKKEHQANKKRMSEILTDFIEEQLQICIFTSISVFTFLRLSKVFSFFVVLANIFLLFLL